MGQKTHPIGFRLGVIQDWQAHWFANKARDYRRLTLEDESIRTLIDGRYGDSGAISRVEIERGPQDLVVTINTARPGIIIGRGGQRVGELRSDLEKLTGKRARLNIQEVRQPELDAKLVGRSVAEQLERRGCLQAGDAPDHSTHHAGRGQRHKDHRLRPSGRRRDRPDPTNRWQVAFRCTHSAPRSTSRYLKRRLHSGWWA